MKEMINYKSNPNESGVDINVYSSAIKGYLDNWYKKNILGTRIESYLDTSVVYCNDRSVTNQGGWDGSGTNYAGANSYLHFKQSTGNMDLSCINTTDRMSISNSEAKLTYPVGLLTEPERGLMGSDYVVTEQVYYGVSPNFFGHYNATVRSVTSLGTAGSKSINAAMGTRPVISLLSDVLIKSGSGITSDPYIVGPIITRDNTSYNY